MMACWVAGLFFLKFWRDTKDRLFATFAAAFWMLAIERIILAMIQKENEIYSYVYVIRFFAFILIIGAIIDKNRTKDH